MLNSGVLIGDLSKMLGHASVRTTERHYAPWVKSRQVLLEEKMRAAMVAQGATISHE
jgi:integrase/recombinase XerD